MDLTQKKLTKSEWESIEIPISETEKKILQVIIDGFDNVNIRYNENQSLLQILKMNSQDTNEISAYFYKEYFVNEIDKMIDNATKVKDKKNKKVVSNVVIDEIESWMRENNPTLSLKKIKKADMIRIQNMSENINTQKEYIFEYLLLSFCDKIVASLVNKTSDYGFYLYTLLQLKKSSIRQINSYVILFVNFIINIATEKTNISEVFHRSPEFIEKNKYLLKYEDIQLFSHQKELFSIFKTENKDKPRLVLYIAPTGTGKTMSPIGLSNKYKIIFVCVARHVGLALAKSAISMGKKVAFAFGCETASDIRLHYYSAVSYSIHNKSGGIYKVDNSVGDNVEIMICDVKSYITAMLYMLAFNSEENIITYWDEPTITMDYPDHPLHETIHNNWVENKISKVILSCATLPKENEIMDTIIDFKSKFEDADVHTITSYDCKKTISILNKDGKCCLPHLLFQNHSELLDCINYCEENKTLLRYFDLEEIVRFIEYLNQSQYVNEPYTINSYFTNISDITMNSIKLFYLTTLKHIDSRHWAIIYSYINSTQQYKFQDNFRKIKSVDSTLRTCDKIQTTNPSTIGFGRMNSVSAIPASPLPQTNPAKGILLTTTDAHTLTDGPTIFLVEDVDKIGKFYIQQSKIPEKVFKEIMDKIYENEVVQKKITETEKLLEDALGKDSEKDKKMEKENFNKDVRLLMNSLAALRMQIKDINIESKYIPNMKQHQELWIPDGKIVENAFIPNIDDHTVKDIMMVDVDNQMKLLLLLGIGVFTNQPNIQYMEIMKKLALEQKLYIIIAQSDYIYGTNYQFCHGFIGKDLINMTQQKTIQAMGRIGRNNIQQEYTVRFRDDSIIMNLFKPMGENIEALNMSKLFSS